MAGGQNMISFLKFNFGLPFVELKVSYNSKEVVLKNVLVDTGSASTILKIDAIESIGIKPEDEDIIGTVSGVGGSEFVYIKTVEYIKMSDLKIPNFKVDIGEMNYGYDFDGIVGMDFLKEIMAVIDLENDKIRSNHG